MKIILFDLPNPWANLLPLTFTRPICHIRTGIFTLLEKWQRIFPDASIIPLSADYLNESEIFDIEDEMLYINASLIPNHQIIQLIQKLQLHEGIKWNNILLAYRGFIKYHQHLLSFPFSQIQFFIHENSPYYQKALIQSRDILDTLPEMLYLEYPFQVFLWNEKNIGFDFEHFIMNLPKGLLSSTNKLIGSEKKLYISPSARVEGSIINTNTGYVYIGDGAEIMEGSLIRGPLALCEGATLKMGTKIYGATTIGPHCKVGGEVTNSVFFAYSNKAHDGFVGNSVIAEWCNLGADTNNSNLKNNYGEVKIFNYLQDKMMDTGLQFCGLIMGDHSKCGINTMFNTGTVVGVATNIFGAGFPKKHIPSFTWGGINDFQNYDITKLFHTAHEMMKRRSKELTDKDKQILQKVMEITEHHRHGSFSVKQ